MTYKWEDSVYLQNEQILDFYKSKSDKCLYFLGKGFDPRMCEGIRHISPAAGDITVCLIEYTEGRNSTSKKYRKQIDQNYKILTGLGHRIIPLNINTSFSRLHVFFRDNLHEGFFKDIDRIIVDISALPQTISFNLIKFLNSRYGKDRKIDIITCENSDFDDHIRATGLSDTANYLSGFSRFSIDMESDENTVKIWLPLLGKNCGDELERIHPFVSPKEICPVLPFPSQNPNKSDEILSAVGELLFSSFEVEKSNILYIAENNVIQAYKKLCSTIEYYKEALEIISSENGETRFIFSTTSSKLIGLGALLASIELTEHNISNSFALVENGGYSYTPGEYHPSKNNIFCLCLNESVYECDYI